MPVEKANVTLANRITFFRVLTIPVFVLLIFCYTRERDWLRLVALGIYGVAALSDAIDGYIARHYNQSSKLGARLDPLADKLIINLGLVFLASNPQFDPAIPLWFPVLVLGRDVAIVMGAFIINEYFAPVKVKPRWSGKATTALQMSTLIAYLLPVFFAPGLLYATAVLTVFSFVDYMYAGSMQVLKRDSA